MKPEIPCGNFFPENMLKEFRFTNTFDLILVSDNDGGPQERL